jgi:hypothetical protein
MGKVTILVALAALVAASAAGIGGMAPLVLALFGMLAYALSGRQHSTLNADPQESRDARARVAANAVPCDWVRPD